MNLKKLLLLVVLTSASIAARADEPPSFGDGTGPEGQPPVDAIPVDGGVSVLAMAGIAYGARRLRAARKK